MKRIYYLLLLFVAQLAVSCSSFLTDHPVSPVTDASIVASQIDLSTINPDLVEYYKDIAVLAEWYADHPAALQKALEFNKTHTDKEEGFDTFIDELADLNLQDENGKPISFFDLSDEARHIFLKDYVKMEAKFQDNKHKMVNGGERLDDFMELQNKVLDGIAATSTFSETFDFDVEAAKIKADNPLKSISDEIEKQQRDLGASVVEADLETAENPGTVNTAEQIFYKTLSVFLTAGTVNFNPLCFNNSPQRFTDKLRGQLKKGLVLVSLPGGDQTQLPLVLNAHSSIYDLGHVAIISKNSAEVPGSIGSEFELTIGTNSSDNMHAEKIQKSWTNQHGMSYLMKPVRKTRKATWKKVLGVSIPTGWETILEDVNHTDTYNKITTVLGKPYCSAPQMLYSMKAAPDRFICSSSAWWAIKEAHKLDISSWYNITIFPSGVFNSDDMQVVAMTF